MAALANGKIIAAECTLAVMTSHATLSASGRMMVKRLRRSNLPALWLTGPDLVTLSTGFFLMFSVTESNTKSLCGLRCPIIATQLMAYAA